MPLYRLRWAVAIPLLLLAAYQVQLLAVRLRGAATDHAQPPELELLAVGDHLDSLCVLTRSGVVIVRLAAAAQGTVVLAFDSQCSFCDSVAPLWRDWMRSHSRNRVVAVTKQTPDSAAAYAERWEWSGVVGSVADRVAGVHGTWLTRRTPWFYVFDNTGKLIRVGHGEDVVKVDSVWPGIPPPRGGSIR
jgi:hypothetical protein